MYVMHRTLFLVVDLLTILGGLKGSINFGFEAAYYVLDVRGDGYGISYCILCKFWPCAPALPMEPPVEITQHPVCGDTFLKFALQM